MLVLRDTSNRGRLFGREGRLCVSHVNNVNIPPFGPSAVTSVFGGWHSSPPGWNGLSAAQYMPQSPFILCTYHFRRAIFSKHSRDALHKWIHFVARSLGGLMKWISYPRKHKTNNPNAPTHTCQCLLGTILLVPQTKFNSNTGIVKVHRIDSVPRTNLKHLLSRFCYAR